jgi:predicted DNA-binding transcriptional regulator AlpA
MTESPSDAARSQTDDGDDVRFVTHQGTPVPDLTALLAADPAAVPEALIPEVLGELERRKAVLWARLALPALQNGPAEDRLLTVAQAAVRLGTTKDWLKRNGHDFPFTVRLSSGQLRYSTDGITRWIRLRTGKS